MEFNTLMRYANNGWTLGDVGLKLALIPTTSRVNAFASRTTDTNTSPETVNTEETNPYTTLQDTLDLSPKARHLATQQAAVAEDSSTRSLSTQDVSGDEQQEIEELQKRDAEVRQHELAHKMAAGHYAGQPVYEYEQGPDGKQYAVGGSVSIDTSPADTPEETIEKASTIIRAAYAPADPSPEDLAVAQKAMQMEQEAQRESTSGSTVSSDKAETTTQATREADIQQQSIAGTAMASTAAETQPASNNASNSPFPAISANAVTCSYSTLSYAAQAQALVHMVNALA